MQLRRRGDDMHRHEGAVGRMQTNLSVTTAVLALLQQGLKRGLIVRQDKVMDRSAQQRLGGSLEHIGQAIIAIKNGAIVGDGGGALLDLFHENTVMMVG